MVLFRKSKSIFLAPMAGYTDSAFRALCSTYGCRATVVPMVSAAALVRENEKTNIFLKESKEEKYFGVQIFGAFPNEISKAVRILCNRKENGNSKLSFIDLNFGCPVRNILKQECGSFLLKHSKRISEIALSAVKASALPITAKIRLGFGKNDSFEIARILEKAGVEGVFVHGRTAKQGFSGKADWDAIGELASETGIPIIGNGDIKTLKEAKEKIKEYGCAGAMIGRSALGNPMAFSSDRKKTERKQAWKKYIALAIRENSSILSIKIHSACFSRGSPNAKRIRRGLMNSKTIEEIEETMKALE